jgi:uncharacterized damage-inducible protein DinB
MKSYLPFRAMQKSLAAVFDKDLKALKKEIELYEKEEDLWKVAEGINNSAGNLCLHILGNLNNYIGAILGNTGYLRNRAAEFTEKTSKAELLESIESTIKMLYEIINKLDSSSIESKYPEEVFGHEMNTDFFLIHLVGHLNYHLGQVNYHRRILCYN